MDNGALPRILGRREREYTEGGSGWGPVTMMRVLVQIRSLKIIQFSSNVDWGGCDGQISDVQEKTVTLTIML
jgi:hypothetical protein